MTKQPITIDGKNFPSHAAAAKYLGLSNSGFSQRLHRHDTHLSRPIHQLDNGIFPVHVSDKQTIYHNAHELGHALNCSANNALARVKKLIEQKQPLTWENLNKPLRPQMKLKVNGKTYYHWQDLADEYHLKIITLRHRYHAGKRDQELVTPVIRRSFPKEIVIDHHSYPDAKSIATAYHRSYQAFIYQFHKYQDHQITEQELINWLERSPSRKEHDHDSN